MVAPSLPNWLLQRHSFWLLQASIRTKLAINISPIDRFIVLVRVSLLKMSDFSPCVTQVNVHWLITVFYWIWENPRLSHHWHTGRTGSNKTSDIGWFIWWLHQGLDPFKHYFHKYHQEKISKNMRYWWIWLDLRQRGNIKLKYHLCKCKQWRSKRPASLDQSFEETNICHLDRDRKHKNTLIISLRAGAGQWLQTTLSHVMWPETIYHKLMEKRCKW